MDYIKVKIRQRFNDDGSLQRAQVKQLESTFDTSTMNDFTHLLHALTLNTNGHKGFPYTLNFKLS